MKRALLVLAAVLAVLIMQAPRFLYGDQQCTIVRVAIMDDADRLRLGIKSGYKITATDSDIVIMAGASFSGQVYSSASGIVVGTKTLNRSSVMIHASQDGDIYINNRRFRGGIEIVRKDNGKLLVVNYIGLEEYLYGVLYHEVSHKWPMEALKTQAVAARTFAIYQMRKNALQPYDLRNDIYSQVYGGKTSEKWSTTRAVDATRGQVLTYNGDIFPSYYHATCAGYTEDASNLWNIDMPVLKGVPCGFCANSPHYTWSKEIPFSDIENKLRESGYSIGKVESVKVLTKNRSGRADKLEIKDSSGVSCVITAKDFRQMLGPNVIRSTKFDVYTRPGQLMVQGLGWGHGVGMCQWGVYGQARTAKKYDAILKYYYPGSEITTIDKLPPIKK